MKKLIFFLFLFNFTNLFSTEIKLEQISDDLNKPWSLSFINNENVIITEKTGKLWETATIQDIYRAELVWEFC